MDQSLMKCVQSFNGMSNISSTLPDSLFYMILKELKYDGRDFSFFVFSKEEIFIVLGFFMWVMLADEKYDKI